jgi:energy-converting hydrogenase B subunit D
MQWELEIVLFIFLIAAAVIALREDDLLAAAVALGVFSFFCAILFVTMGAVDVGFTEAVVGAGITSVLFIADIAQTTRKTKD